MSRSVRLLGAVMMTMCCLGPTLGCGGTPPPLPPGITVADGLALEIVATGFDRPTQLAAVDDRRFVIGELAGAENDATGELTLFDLDEPDIRTTLSTGLDKPTGVAVIDDRIFVMESTRLRMFPFADDGSGSLELSDPAVVAADLPNNGRSQGSLSTTPGGELLFNTSGRKRGAERTEGSATLFSVSVTGDDAGPPRELATGFKHAYAHTTASDGRLFVVEMTDGTFDGQRAQDELLAIEQGDDAGWPFCVDDNRPVVEFGGDEARCADVPESHALFGAGATPTAVVEAPWDRDLLIVTLWISSQVVGVPRSAVGAPHPPRVLIEGIESPQSLLVDGDRVLVVDHETGTIFALTEA